VIRSRVPGYRCFWRASFSGCAPGACARKPSGGLRSSFSVRCVSPSTTCPIESPRRHGPLARAMPALTRGSDLDAGVSASRGRRVER
jgi:hypothetical protein